MNLTKLIDFAENVYSQNGEDGIIQEILSRRGCKTNGLAVEFGAADGKFMSNTFNLAKNYQWNALYIEGVPELFVKLEELAGKYPTIDTLNKMVAVSGDDSLDEILNRHWYPYYFDILSIDIDGFDYQVWDSVHLFNPQIVIIEINSSIPVGIEQIHDPDNGKQGSSFTSMLNLGSSKGYSLVCHTGNMIFVDNHISHLFSDVEINSDNLFIDKWIKKPKNV